ncbi:ABC transporter substrate-binding protein [Ottowia caeni]|uniref:ABC transporter substrate-binding protein n=1 Tax=Ottowia caeni TaxID=2870339 RepID=UPI001E5416E1|nr:ABC transporter substrate-binding protein [Ottowia caeni]
MSEFVLPRRVVLSMACAASMMGIALPVLAQSQPVHGGVLTAILFPEPPSLNLALQQVQGTQMVAGKIYESLLQYSKKLEPMPSLAASWTVSPDRLTYTFNLQKGVKWHDGKPFSSADVVFTYKEILANTARTRTLMENVADLSAPNADTVVFKLKKPYSAFLFAHDIGGGAILPKHLYQGTELSKNEYNNAPVGTGPFKFVKWVRGSHVELAKNTDYWRKGLPYLDGITYRVIPDAASRRLAIEQGTVLQAIPGDVDPVDIARVSKLPHLKTSMDGGEYWSTMNWVEFNTAVAPMNDKRFRQAVMHAVDRQFLLDKIVFGQGKVSTGPIHHNTRFYDSNVKKYNFDPKKAVALLDEMGLKPDAKGVRANVNFIALPYGENYRRQAEYFKMSLAKVGIVVNLESADVGAWVRRVGNHDYHMAGNGVFQYGDPAIGVARTYISSNIKKGLMFSNTSQYSNPKVDELFAKAAEAPDAERQALYTQIQQQIVEDVPVMWMYDTLGTTFFHKRVNNAYTTGLGYAGSYAEAWLSK